MSGIAAYSRQPLPCLETQTSVYRVYPVFPVYCVYRVHTTLGDSVDCVDLMSSE